MASRFIAFVVLTALGGCLVASANASEVVGKNAKNPRLAVSANGQALVTYRLGRKTVRVQAWGGVNARTPSATQPQVRFRIQRGASARFRNACRPYRAPELDMLVAACQAPDGSYWALQTWQRELPNYGVRPTARERAWELRLSHWHGPLAEITVWPDWVYGGRFHGIFGRLMYGGTPVFGFRATPSGAPLDAYGRNVYLDTYNSAYGRGWRRENSFLAHRDSGIFCYGFYAFRTPRRATAMAGHGSRYRLTVIGPGVTPDIRWEGEGLPNFDRTNQAHVLLDQSTNELRRAMLAGDSGCRG